MGTKCLLKPWQNWPQFADWADNKSQQHKIGRKTVCSVMWDHWVFLHGFFFRFDVYVVLEMKSYLLTLRFWLTTSSSEFLVKLQETSCSPGIWDTSEFKFSFAPKPHISSRLHLVVNVSELLIWSFKAALKCRFFPSLQHWIIWLLLHFFQV